jgi:hypothetical protein
MEKRVMKHARVLAAVIVAAGAMAGGAVANAAPTTAAAHVLGPIRVDDDGTASVTVQYVCPAEGTHLWVSAKQVASGKKDARLGEEGSSAISAGWWQSHPTDFTCDGAWHTDTFTIGTFEYGIGELQHGKAWLQFCVTNEESLFVNQSGWVEVV